MSILFSFKKNLLTILVGGFLSLTSLSCTASIPCPQNNPHCLLEKMGRHPVRHQKYWKDKTELDFSEKVFIADDKIVEYLGFDNRLNHIHTTPKKPKNNPGLVKEVKTALKNMPPAVKKLIGSKLAGIVLVDKLGSTGYTDHVLDENNNIVSSFIVLDMGVLKRRTGNQWATWRESSPFIGSAKYRLQATIANPRKDTRIEAIRYILLHEFGHVVAQGLNVHPQHGLRLTEQSDLRYYPYTQLSWKIEKGQYYSLYDEGLFPERSKVAYYSKGNMNNSHMASIYNKLEKTNFSTLYSAISPFEDWAESFASYIHTQIDKKPWKIEIFKNGTLLKEYHSCWGHKRCAQKALIIKNIIEEENQ